MVRGNCLCGGIRFRIAGQLYGALRRRTLRVKETKTECH
jgi:hypothetical protein